MNLLNSIDKRTYTLIQNAGLSSLYRILGIVINLFLIPLQISILGLNDYGLWAVIGSILAWLNFFDLGITNSLRNQIAHTIAQKKTTETKTIISSSYFLLISIAVVLFSISILLLFKTDWLKMLNLPPKQENSFKISLLLISGSIFTQLILRQIGAILFAHQKSNIVELINICCQFATLILTILIKYTSVATPLLTISQIYSITPLFIWLVSNIIVFKYYYPEICPSILSIKSRTYKKTLQTSTGFFFLQLYGLILFQSDNMIIAKIFNSYTVSQFSILSKYFNFLSVFLSVILTPYWSAISEAYAVSDYNWIKNIYKKNIFFIIIILTICIIMAFSANYLIELWTHEDLDLPIELSLLVCLATFILALNNINAIILNASNKLRIQILLALFIILIKIPLSFFLIEEVKMGLKGLVISNIICLLLFGFFISIQAYKIISRTATGIWNK